MTNSIHYRSDQTTGNDTGDGNFEYGCKLAFVPYLVVLSDATVGHIIEAFTGDGRRLYYKYDSYGDLVQATLPDGSSVSYQYSHQPNLNGQGFYSEHLLIEEDKPQGRVLVNAYDDATSRRVTQQQATVGQDFALITNARFGYFAANGAARPADAPNTPISGSTVVTDVNLNTARYEYAGSLITKITDQLGQTVAQTWYQAGDPAPGYPRSLKSRTDKRGLREEYQYDGNGNLAQKKLTGDLFGDGNPGSVAISSSIYNSNNLVAQTTDPLGNIANYAYTDANHPYQPTSIEKRAAGGTVSTKTLQYQDVSAGGISAYGLLQVETEAAGTADQAITAYTNNANGFVTQIARPTGTTDPPVVVNYTFNLRGELTSETDALGRATKYAYDGRGHRIWTEWHDETGALISWWYDYYNQNGEIEWSDGPRYSPEDYVLKQYDGAGRLSQELKWRSEVNAAGTGVEAVPGVDAAYASTFFVHDAFGNLTEVRDPRHNSTTAQYDGLGQMTGRQRHGGDKNAAVLSSESFLYEPGGEVSQYTNPLGGVTGKLYTSTGKLKQQSDAVTGTVLSWRYDALGRVVKETLSNGSYWATAYDDLNRTITRTFYSSDGTQQALETASYDRRGNLIARTDSEGNQFTSTYDALNRIKSTAGPGANGATAQEAASHTYGAGEKVHIVVDALGQKTHTVTDALRRPILAQVKDKKNNIIRQRSYAYSPDHNSVTVVEGVGATALATTTFTDTFNQPVLVKHGDGTLKAFAYDSNENLIASQDEDRNVTSNSYDALNRLSTQTLPGGAATTSVYDAAGNALERRMPGGQVHQQTFDNASRKTGEQLVGADGSSTRNFSYTYYPGGSAFAGLPQATSDPRGVTFTTTGYDAFLRPQAVTAAGSLAQQNQTTTYGFDTLSRLTSVAQSFGDPSTGPPTLVARSYDGYGHIQAETVSISGAVQSQFNQTWDGAGNRSSLASTLAAQGIGAGRTANFGYWADGLLKQTSVAANNFNFNYDKNALLTSRQNAWRTQAITQRDALGRVLAEDDAVGAGTPLSESQTWGGRDTRYNYTANRSGSGVWNESRGYGYNGRGQLLYESDAPAAGGYADFLYRFDFESVTTLPSGSGLGVRTVAYRRNASNDPLVEAGSLLTFDPAFYGGANPRGVDAFQRPVTEVEYSGGNTASYVNDSYDEAGQALWRSFLLPGTTQLVEQSLAWDAFGRLAGVYQQNDSTGSYADYTYVYDGLGRRLRANIAYQYDPTTSTLTLGGQSVDSFYDPQVEFLEVGVAVNGTRTWKAYGPDLNGRYGALQGIGGLEATIDETSGTVTPLVNDAFGNIAGTASGGVMSWNSARVGSYGVLPGSTAPVLDTTHTLTQALLWRSYRIDPTGLYYMGGRYYEPTSGRFVSPDPLGHAASMDLYSYAGGDACNGLDPTGRLSTSKLTDGDRSMGIETGQSMGFRTVYPQSPNASVTFSSTNGITLDGHYSNNRGGGGVSLGLDGDQTIVATAKSQGADIFSSERVTGMAFSGLATATGEVVAGITSLVRRLMAPVAASSTLTLSEGMTGSGGRLGGTGTRSQLANFGEQLQGQGFRVTGGGSVAKEQWIPGPGGGLKGGTFVDLTATDGTTTIRIQTVDTLADGVTLTPSEASAAARIRTTFPNDILFTIPKPKNLIKVDRYVHADAIFRN